MADSLRCCYCQRVDSNIKRCSKCYSVYYCSKGCQTMDWTGHKTSCKRIFNSSSKLAAKYEFTIKEASVKGHNSSRKKHLRRTQSSNTSVKTCDVELENKIIESEIKPFRKTDKDSECSSESGKVSENFGGAETENEHCSGSVYANEFVSTVENTRTLSNGSDTDRKRFGDARDARKSPSRKDSANQHSDRVEKVGESSSGAIKGGSSSSEVDIVKTCEANICAYCSKSGCTLKCSRCMETFYCLKSCQIKDWRSHKGTCIKKLTTEEEEIMKIREKKKKEREETLGQYQEFAETKNGKNSTVVLLPFQNFEGPRERMFQMLPLKQALLIATRPEGSLIKAIWMASILFPLHNIVMSFDDIPSEPMFPFFPFMVPPRGGYVLVAFMYRYHEHVMRHGVYLKDAQDKRSKVEFYLDHIGDNPYPFFTCSQVKPG